MTTENEANLRDALIRQQVYLERVKLDAHAESDVDGVGEYVAAGVIAALMALGVRKLSEVTLRELRKLMTKLRNMVGTRFKKLRRQIEGYLRKFTAVEGDVTDKIFSKNGKRTPRAEKPTAEQLRTLTRNALVAAFGTTTPKALADGLARMRDELIRMVTTNYADAAPIEDLIERIRGTRARAFRDGWVDKIKRNVKTVISTGIQNISSYAGTMFGQLYFERYQWVSVIDSRTSEICTNRDGKVYRYGDGPLPPAHPNCRSKVVPYIEEELDAWRGEDWYSWARRQPYDILADMTDPATARAILSDSARSEDFPRLTEVRRLRLADYGNRADRMNGA